METNGKNIDDIFKSNLENRDFKIDDNHLEDLNNQLNNLGGSNNIDDLFKRKLNKREFNLDKNHLSNLERQLNQLRRVKLKYWYRAAAVLLFLLASGLLYFNNYENPSKSVTNNEKININNQISKRNLKPENLEIKNKPDLENGVEKNIKKEVSKSKEKQNNNLKTTNSNIKSVKKQVVKPVSINSYFSKKILPTLPIRSNKTKELTETNNFIEIAENSEEILTTNSENNLTENKGNEIINNLTPDTILNGFNNSIVTDSINAFQILNDSTLLIKDSSESEIFLKKDSILEVFPQTILDSAVTDSILENPDSVKLEMEELFDSLKIDNKLSISFSIGSNYNMKQTSILDPSQGIAPNPRYSQTLENCIFNLPADLRIRYKLNKSLSISTGISTNSFGEKIDYNHIHEIYMVYDSNFIDTVCDIGTFQIPYFNSITNQMDTSTYNVIMDTSYWENENYEESNINNFNVQNRYTYLNVPFMIGYEFKINKLNIVIRAGGAVGFRINNSLGMYYNTNIQSLHGYEMRKTIFNLTTTASIGYQFNKIEIFVEPKYWINLTNTMSINELNHKYHLFGANIGLAWRL